MDAEDVLEAGAEPEGLGSAEGSTDGAQLVRYVNPAQYAAICQRRLACAAERAAVKDVAPRQITRYKHESRHVLAMKRVRGPNGRFGKEIHAEFPGVAE
ncbi:hypothetical protein Ctob_001281 [Chrysochromulina tobinii]|uniref:Nuclear transcription factor Y subunit n=1 Tax=Chrysochromulina tobinii TaxID=1460289 RepID=A0A0M0J4Z8_9EUKA|nr:hypothetical protein Ctob_001281 [Chrysochromulina tobinii]|eukprot:KOO21694.1 hypothetical protein Ctob_001281 [Chrysochromulina sp. CCMP291]